MTKMRGTLGAVLAAMMLTTSLAGRPTLAQTTTDSVPPTPSAIPETQQTFLGPGMYMLQTRVRNATCGDDEATGFVDSFIAPIHGVSGSRRMVMHLLNSQYWPDWQIAITDHDEIFGDSSLHGFRGSDPPTNHFRVTRHDAARYTGLGVRRYRGQQGQPCEVYYDALLRRIDV